MGGWDVTRPQSRLFSKFFQHIYLEMCVRFKGELLIRYWDLKNERTKIVQNTKKKKRNSEHLAHSNSTRISWVREN